MRSLEHLEQKKKAKRMRNNVPPPDEEMEDELDFPRFVPLNRAKSAFDDGAGKTFGGINTAPSVFDAKAAIRTDEP
jgi:hypothetical protein